MFRRSVIKHDLRILHLVAPLPQIFAQQPCWRY